MSQPNQYCQIPPQNVPFLNSDGTVAQVWYKFLHDLHTISGAGTPGHGLTRWIAGNAGYPNAQVGYRPQNVGLGLSPVLIVFDQITGAGSPVSAAFPVGFVTLTPFV